jgi:hypothetical protein
MKTEIEYKYLVTLKLDESECIKTIDSKIVILMKGKISYISHIDFEFDVWAKDRSKALIKANKILKGTLGIISSTVSEDYKTTRLK